MNHRQFVAAEPYLAGGIGATPAKVAEGFAPIQSSGASVADLRATPRRGSDARPPRRGLADRGAVRVVDAAVRSRASIGGAAGCSPRHRGRSAGPPRMGG